MSLALMQPYLFPYLGYFQLIHASDTFVVYDDVNYIKGGWINRNHLLANGVRQLFTLPLSDASPNKLINEICLRGTHGSILKSIRQNYGKAPQFANVFPLVEEVLDQKEINLARFVTFGLHRLCEYLGLHPNWYLSSSLDKDNTLRGQGKVLAICEELGVKQYINAPGGRHLYDTTDFLKRGIRLSFVQPRDVVYQQFGNEFIPNLSIIDVMMFNDQSQCRKLIEEYDIA